jgi:hypothetical protein
LDDQTVVLIDTPGFDSILQTDSDIVADLQKHLNQHYQGRHLHAIVYLHNISIPRLAGSSKASLDSLRRICGNAASSVQTAIVTTFCDRIQPKVGEQRQAELWASSDLLQDLLKNGAILVKMPHSRSEKQKLVAYLLEKSNDLHVSSTAPEIPQDLFYDMDGSIPLRTASAPTKVNDALKTTMSLNALAQLVTAQEDAFAKREAALAARERILHDAEQQSRDGLNSLRRQFETRLKSRTEHLESALSRANGKCNELGELLDNTLKMHQDQIWLNARKDKKIEKLNHAQFSVYVAGQYEYFRPEWMGRLAALITTSEDMQQTGDIEIHESLTRRGCDVCMRVKSGDSYGRSLSRSSPSDHWH